MGLRLRELRHTSAARSILAALVLGLLALGVAACDDDDEEASDIPRTPVTTEDPAAATYDVQLDELNDSGVSGEATLELTDGTLTVDMQAEGLVPDMPHPQHVHQTAAAGAATCPTPDLDTDGDGRITLEEGAPAYGPVALPLEPFPTAPGGTLEFSETYETVPAEAQPLEEGVIVLHGGMVEGEYVATLPVACGTIG